MSWLETNFHKAQTTSYNMQKKEQNKIIRSLTRKYHASNIIHHNSCSCTSVVHRSQAMVSLLPCCVPYIKLYGSFIQWQNLCEECCSNCWFLQRILTLEFMQLTIWGIKKWTQSTTKTYWKANLEIIKLAFDESQYQTCFPSSHVPKKYLTNA